MEQSENNPRPIVEESTERTPMEVTMMTIDGTDWQLRRVENISSCLLRVMSGTATPTDTATAFMELKALEDYIKGNDGYGVPRASFPSNPNLIPGEPTLLEALDVVSRLIDQHSFPEDWVVDESTYSDDLCTLQEKIVKGLNAVRSEAEERHHDDGPADDAPSIADELEDADLEGWN